MPLDSRTLTTSTSVDLALNIRFESLLNQGRVTEAARVFDSDPPHLIDVTPPTSLTETHSGGSDHLSRTLSLEIPSADYADLSTPDTLQSPSLTSASPPFEDFDAPSSEHQPPLVWTTPENEQFTGSEPIQRALTVHINEDHTLVHVPRRPPVLGTAPAEHAFIDTLLDILDASHFLLDEWATRKREIIDSIFGADIANA